MSQQVQKVLFVHSAQSSWVDNDIKIISKHFDLYDLLIKKKTYLRDLFSGMKQLGSSDIVFCWFGSLLFLPLIILAKIFNKKVVIVAGGYDVAKTSRFVHGAFDKGLFYQYFTRLLFRLSDKVLAVSEFNKNEAISNAKVNPEKVSLIPLGFEISSNMILNKNTREKIVTMISNLDALRFYLKGADQFCELAKMNPGYLFQIVGSISPETRVVIEKLDLSNLVLLGEIEFNSKGFNQILNNSMYIAQLSEYESFGAAVVDGAVRGCCPIVSDQAALLEIVSNGMGVIIPRGKLKVLEDISNTAFELSEFYQNKYPLDRRERLITEALSYS